MFAKKIQLKENGSVFIPLAGNRMALLSEKIVENSDELFRVAEALAEGLDFMRVDLYVVDGRIYFGEMTCYQGGGCNRFPKREDDFCLGKNWKIKPVD